MWGSKPKIKASSERRERQQRDGGGNTSPPWRETGNRLLCASGIGGSEQAPGDLHARCVRFDLANQSRGQIAFDFIQLIAIDHHIAARAPVLTIADERPNYRAYGCRGHYRKDQQ